MIELCPYCGTKCYRTHERLMFCKNCSIIMDEEDEEGGRNYIG